MTELTNILSKPCGRCQAGHKQLQLVTLMTWLDDELITVPDFPAWICDICGHRNYDTRALAQLSLVLNPEAGQPVKQQTARPTSSPLQGLPPIS